MSDFNVLHLLVARESAENPTARDDDIAASVLMTVCPRSLPQRVQKALACLSYHPRLTITAASAVPYQLVRRQLNEAPNQAIYPCS